MARIQIVIANCVTLLFYNYEYQKKVPYPKNVCNMSQSPSNPGFRSVKVQTEDFLKKDSQHFKKYFQFEFLWIRSKTGKQNWNVLFLLIFIIVKKQCGVNQICHTWLPHDKWILDQFVSDRGLYEMYILY